MTIARGGFAGSDTDVSADGLLQAAVAEQHAAEVFGAAITSASLAIGRSSSTADALRLPRRAASGGTRKRARVSVRGLRWSHPLRFETQAPPFVLIALAQPEPSRSPVHERKLWLGAASRSGHLGGLREVGRRSRGHSPPHRDDPRELRRLQLARSPSEKPFPNAGNGRIDSSPARALKAGSV
jgi:hypothetical protein